MKQTSHKDRGTDYHLRALGFSDRMPLRVLSADKDIYSDGLITCKPDWLIANTETGIVIDIEYKNRILGNGLPSLYEYYQVIANMIVLDKHFRDKSEYQTPVRGVLIYGDGQRVEIVFDRKERRKLYMIAMDIVSLLHFKGVTKKLQDTVCATNLARYMVDPDFNNPHFMDITSMRQGTKAHHDMQNMGPSFMLEKERLH